MLRQCGHRCIWQSSIQLLQDAANIGHEIARELKTPLVNKLLSKFHSGYLSIVFQLDHLIIFLFQLCLCVHLHRLHWWKDLTWQAEKQTWAWKTISQSLTCTVIPLYEMNPNAVVIRVRNSQILASFESRNGKNDILSSWSGLKSTYFICREGQCQSLEQKISWKLFVEVFFFLLRFY